MIEKPKLAGILLLDLNAESPKPFNLTLEGFSDAATFNPHGICKWISKDGSMYLYVINHRLEGDTVESFEYQPSKKQLVHRKTISDPLFWNLNAITVTDLDKFYVTVDHYFQHPILKEVEVLSRLALAYVLYFDGQSSKVASDLLKYPNGITKSRDGRYVLLALCPRPSLLFYCSGKA